MAVAHFVDEFDRVDGNADKEQEEIYHGRESKSIVIHQKASDGRSNEVPQKEG